MCGIAGIIHKQAGKGANIGEQMTSMLQALKHRGPCLLYTSDAADE